MNTLKQKGGKTREVEHLEHGLVDISSMLAEQTGLPHRAILTRYVWRTYASEKSWPVAFICRALGEALSRMEGTEVHFHLTWGLAGGLPRQVTLMAKRIGGSDNRPVVMVMDPNEDVACAEEKLKRYTVVAYYVGRYPYVCHVSARSPREASRNAKEQLVGMSSGMDYSLEEYEEFQTVSVFLGEHYSLYSE